MSNNNSNNNRPYSTLHSPQVAQDFQTDSLHTPIEQSGARNPYLQRENSDRTQPLASSPTSPNTADYYPTPPLPNHHSFSGHPHAAAAAEPDQPGLPPLPGVETFMMTAPPPTQSPPPPFESHQYQGPLSFPPPPVPSSPPPAFNPLDPNPQQQQQHRDVATTLAVPPLFTSSLNPSDPSTGPQTPKTPVYTPGAAAGPNGAIHAPGQIGHPNQSHGPVLGSDGFSDDVNSGGTASVVATSRCCCCCCGLVSLHPVFADIPPPQDDAELERERVQLVQYALRHLLHRRAVILCVSPA